jgi:1-aminocyclopropane-1-carboxylate deaminase/D-cysteine desulfhydrase-like pyridoxal-dependent ACC family enzyme
LGPLGEALGEPNIYLKGADRSGLASGNGARKLEFSWLPPRSTGTETIDVTKKIR